MRAVQFTRAGLTRQQPVIFQSTMSPNASATDAALTSYREITLRPCAIVKKPDLTVLASALPPNSSPRPRTATTLVTGLPAIEMQYDPWGSFTTLFSGATIQLNLCWQVASSDASSLEMVYNDQSWFALK
jgi:hypothetical protein